MTTPLECKTEYDFTLILAGGQDFSSEIADALYAAGCDDATLSVRAGRGVLAFSRAAPSLKAAILSAINDVWKAGVGLDVVRVDHCNLVTQSDIARRIGRSRQLVHQYIIGARGPGGFPATVCDITDSTPLWYWCEVAYWLWENNMIKADALEEAEEVAAINNALEARYHRKRNPALAREMAAFVDSH